MLKEKLKSLVGKKTKDKPTELVEEKATKRKKQRFKLSFKPKEKKPNKRKRKIVKKNRVSIDIGTKDIKIVEGLYDGKGVVIKNVITVPTPPNSCSDGQIQDMDSLRNALNIALLNGGIDSKEVIYTIQSKSIISREINLPSVIEKDIKNMLQFEVGEYFPVNLDDYVVQKRIVDQVDNDEEKRSTVLVSILPKEITEEYIELTESLNLKPVALDMNDNSIYKLLNDSFLNGGNDVYKNSTISIIDIGFKSTKITIVENGVFKFSRIIDIGGQDIDMNISNSYNLSLADSETRKLCIQDITQIEIPTRNLSLADAEVAASTLDTSENMVKEAVVSSLDELCQSIETIFRYYTSRSANNTINYIYIYGATSKMMGIDKYIENTFNIRTFKINRLSNIITGRKHKDVDTSIYANAIGAIIRK